MTTINALDLRRRLGREEWGPPTVFGTDGWAFYHHEGGRIIVTSSDFPELPGVEIIHASISSPVGIPAYVELAALHRAVWPNGFALQAFVPAHEHINIHAHALHLWGRADGARLWPIDFGQYGTI